jgi:hypothetical protein
VVFQQWENVKIVEQWCFNNGKKGQEIVNSGVSAMGKRHKVAEQWCFSNGESQKVVEQWCFSNGERAKSC